MTFTVRVFRGLPFYSDSRVSRYGKYLEHCKIFFHTWEGDGDSELPANVIRFFLNKSPRFYYLRYLIYLLYLFFYSLLKIKKSDICICMDLDTYLPIKIGSYFRSPIVIFDVVDPAAHSRFKKIPFKKFIDDIELRAINSASQVIFPNKSRIAYYKEQLGREVTTGKKLILENIPAYSSRTDSYSVVKSQKLVCNKCGDMVVIGYFGTLDESRNLHLLLDLAECFPEDVFILIAGSGPIASQIENYSAQRANLEFLGRYTPGDLQFLYELIDFTWMCYDERILLHKYAAPNKFYEHLRYRKPAIVNSVIPQSKFIKSNNTGLIFDQTTVNKENNLFVLELKNFRTKFDFSGYWESNYANCDSVSSQMLMDFLNIRQ